MRSGRLARLLRVTALVAVLVTAQTAALTHSDLDDSHPAGDICALCVGLATLGCGNVTTPQQLDVVEQRPERFVRVVAGRVGGRIENHPARGPPQAS